MENTRKRVIKLKDKHGSSHRTKTIQDKARYAKDIKDYDFNSDQALGRVKRLELSNQKTLLVYCLFWP